jgi:hypothetical protein
LEKRFSIAQTSVEREHQGLEKEFNIAETSAKSEHQGLEKGFNIAETSVEGKKLHHKHPRKNAWQRKCACIINYPSYILGLVL